VRRKERERRDVAHHQGGLQLAQQQRLARRHLVEHGRVCGRSPHRLERVQPQAVDLDDSRVALGREPGDRRTQREIEQPPRRGGADDEAHAWRNGVQRADHLDVS
jgi:hypothetical protein